MQEALVRSLGQEYPLEKGQATHSGIHGLPLVAQMVKNLPAVRNTWVLFLVWEDSLEEAWQPTAVHSPGECPGTEEPAGL